jgi:lysophospholipase L1-like esterase
MIFFPLKINNNAFFGDWIENDQGIFTTNLGSQIYLSIENATKLIINMKNTVHDNNGPSAVAYKIDNQEWQSLDLSDQELVFSIPDTNEHSFRLITQGLTTVRGDYWNGTERFLVESISSDGLIGGNVPDKDMIIFFGDSITNGQKMQQPAIKPSSHHPELSYGIKIAEQLDLNGLLIAYGGIGITNKAKFLPPTANDFVWNINKETLRPLHYEKKIKLVIVNIGTNDADASDKEFSFSLKSLNRELHKRFHDIKILYLIPFNQQFADVYRKNIIEFENAKLIETQNWEVEIGDRVHPNFKGEKKIIEKLLPIIKEEINDN